MPKSITMALFIYLFIYVCLDTAKSHINQTGLFKEVSNQSGLTFWATVCTVSKKCTILFFLA